MAVSAIGQARPAANGLQPFDARRHMRQVAALVSDVFANELDAQGRQALGEMQLAGRLSPLLGNLLSSAFFGEFVSGHVWLEAGQVVGNVTLQRGDFAGSRWRISNVAVAPAFRGRGIARALMRAVLREIALKGGRWAILQVRQDNNVARRLYEEMGFSHVCSEGIWQLDAPPVALPDPQIPMRRLRAAAWRERFELAQAARTSLANWAEPLQATEYQTDIGRMLAEMLGNLTGLHRVSRWGVYDGPRLLGAVETRASIGPGPHTLSFAVHPRARGEVETALIHQGLRSLAEAVPRPVRVAHSGDHAEGVAALEAAGFRAQRVLLMMRRLITPGDINL